MSDRALFGFSVVGMLVGTAIASAVVVVFDVASPVVAGAIGWAGATVGVAAGMWRATRGGRRG